MFLSISLYKQRSEFVKFCFIGTSNNIFTVLHYDITMAYANVCISADVIWWRYRARYDDIVNILSWHRDERHDATILRPLYFELYCKFKNLVCNQPQSGVFDREGLSPTHLA